MHDTASTHRHDPSSSVRSFDTINAGFRSVFEPERLTLGLVVPIEHYRNSAVPTLDRHIERVQMAEALGFGAVWLRDVPFNVPDFGDAGQVFDPFVYLGALATQTATIALGVASIILPLRHPAHVAKAAATADVLSNGRLLLGIASGDRPQEYPAMNQDFDSRGERFRQSVEYLRHMNTNKPRFANAYGRVHGGIDMLPKSAGTRLPLLITGSSQQAPDWIAQQGDGWMTYPRPAQTQSRLIQAYRSNIERAGLANKPVMEPLYVDLAADADEPPTSIHLGIRTGIHALRTYLRARQAIGVNHIALNLRFNHADVESTLTLLAQELLPEFSN